MSFPVTDRSASARTGIRMMGVALATAAIVVAGCSSAASTSAPTSVSSATSTAAPVVTAAPASVTPSTAASVAASKSPAARQLDYARIVAAAKYEIDGNVVPTFDSVKFSVGSLFTGTPNITADVDKAKIDALLVTFGGKDKAAALTAGDTLFKTLSDALLKRNIASDEVLAGIYAWGQVNVAGWKEHMDSVYANA